MTRNTVKKSSYSSQSQNQQGKSHVSTNVKGKTRANRKTKQKKQYKSYDPNVIDLCLSHWNGAMLAKSLKQALYQNNQTKELLKTVCFLFLTIQDFDDCFISTHLTRSLNNEGEQRFQALCKKWEKENKNSRQSDYFRRGLSDEVFTDIESEKQLRYFSSEIPTKPKKKCQEVDGILWGQIPIGNNNRPKNGLCSNIRKTDGSLANVARFIGHKNEALDNGKKENKKFKNFFINNFVLSNNGKIKETKVSHRVVAEHVRKFSDEVVYQAGFVDEFGHQCTVNYAIPIVFSDEYIGRIRVGFSTQPQLGTLELFINIVFRVVTQLYNIAQKRKALIPEVFDPQRRQISVIRFGLIQEIRKTIENNSENPVREEEIFRRYIDVLLRDSRMNKYLESLAFLQITIPSETVGQSSGSESKDLTFNIWTKDSKLASDTERNIAQNVRTLVNQFNEEKLMYLMLDSNDTFQHKLGDYLGKPEFSSQNWQELPLFEVRKEWIESNKAYKDNPSEENKKKRQEAFWRRQTLRNITKDFSKELACGEDKKVSKEEVLKIEVVNNGILAESNKPQPYLLVLNQPEFLEQRIANFKKDVAHSKPPAIEIFTDFDTSVTNVKTFDYPISLGIWSLFSVMRQAKERKLALTDVSGREGTLVVCIPVIYNNICYRMFAVFSATNEHIGYDPDNDKELRIDKRYYDDLYNWFRDAVFCLESNRTFVSYKKETQALKLELELERQKVKTEKAEKDALELARQVNFVDGHDAKNVMTMLSDNINEACYSLLEIACACVNRDIDDPTCVCQELDKVRDCFNERPSLPDGSQLTGFDVIQNHLSGSRGIKNLPKYIENLDQTLASFRWLCYDLNNNYRIRDILQRVANKKRESRYQQDENVSFVGSIFCKSDYYNARDNAEISKILEVALNSYQNEISFRQYNPNNYSKKLSPISLDKSADLDANTLIIQPQFSRKTENQNSIKIRPGDWFYATIFQRIFHNIGVHGVGEGVNAKVAKIKDALALSISNRRKKDDKKPLLEEWKKINESGIAPDRGGLWIIHDLLENTQTGEMYVRRDERYFEVALVLTGLEIIR